MTTRQVADLTRCDLDAAVLHAEGMTSRILGGVAWFYDEVNGYGVKACRPSTDWAEGGPIIERERIDLYTEHDFWVADFAHGARDDGVQRTYARGETALIAAMRAFVASRFGETVELP